MKKETIMGMMTGKALILIGGERAVLKDKKSGSIGYGITTAYAKEGVNI